MHALPDDPEPVVAAPWILATRWRRVVVGVLFTLVPIVSFASVDLFLAPEWQEPTAEWGSIFANPTRGPLEVGLLTLFGIGTAVIAWRPTVRHHPLGQAVLAGAAVLSGFYAVALTVASGGLAILMAISLIPLAAIVSVLASGTRALNDRAPAGIAPRVGVALTIAALIAIVPQLTTFVLTVAVWSLFALLGAGPMLCFAVATQLLMSGWAPNSLSRVLPAATGIGAATASILVTWQRAMEYHATLSPTDPYGDCYVASAAARGHRSIVGSWSAPTASGTIAVTNQLVHLKAVELLVRSASPSLHRSIRFGYDRVGPHLAARVTSPVRADVAWVTLLPFGLAARLILAVLPAGTRELVAQLHPPATQRPPASR